MKRISFILAAAVVFAVGSAFTSAKNSEVKPNKKGFTAYNFVRVSGAPDSTNRLDYEYRPTNGCQAADDIICKANWEQSGGTPTVGAHPLTSATFSSVTDQGSRVVQ